MEREIKFRAWVVEGNRFAKPGELVLSFNRDRIITQFTGLHDKNGKEIYEGDILKRDTGYIFKVEISEYSIGPLTKVYGYSLHPEDEIIGNIFENPELL